MKRKSPNDYRIRFSTEHITFCGTVAALDTQYGIVLNNNQPDVLYSFAALPRVKQSAFTKVSSKFLHVITLFATLSSL